MEDENYKEAEEECSHKLWKTRVNGYEKVANLFKQIEDKKSSEFAKYISLVKKFVIDCNVVANEKGLEATLAFVENYAYAGKTVSEIMSALVAKSMAAPKIRIRELALQITLMYIEIEKQDAVKEELIKGMELKNPKIVAACVHAYTVALREFGIKIISAKPLLKKIGALLSDRDKGVRDGTKLMVIEIFRWIGGALRPWLEAPNLHVILITELEAEFAKIEGQRAVPTRYIRSQQVKRTSLAEQPASGDDIPENDPCAMAPAVEILSKVSKDFYQKIESKKWQDRKEVLDTVENLINNTKLENEDYGDLVRALNKVIQTDSNIACIIIASRCIAGLARGLKKKFQTYCKFCVSAILGKFKEKKQNVVTALREACDAIYITTTLESIIEDVIEALNNKNPSVKTETSLFLTRAFRKTPTKVVTKKILKAITVPLIKNINEPDPAVRESSTESLGTLMKLTGEMTIAPFLVELENEKLKMAKIKEICDNTVIKRKNPGAPEKAIKNNPNKPEPKASSPGIVKSFLTDELDTLDDNFANDSEQENTQDVTPKIDLASQITDSILNDLRDKNWKVRHEALVKLKDIISEAKYIKPSLGDLPQALTPRLTDSNVKLAQLALWLCEAICKAMGTFFKQYIRVFLPTVLQGLGDSKHFIRTASLNAINTFKDHCGYKEFFKDGMIADALKSGSPALKIEVWNWLAQNLPKVPPKQILKNELMVCVPLLYSNLEDRNTDVRKNAQEAVLGMMLHLGFKTMFKQTENLKPASRTLVIAELEKPKPNLLHKPLPTDQQPIEKEDKAMLQTKSVTNANNAVIKSSESKSAPASSLKKDDVDTSSLLVVNNLKPQRIIDESKLLKWKFTHPREEFVEQLKDQMNAAKVNKTLIANMFHSDFRYHLKALDTLNHDLTDNSEALISNLDLILKWLTLRFFDTNPSVLLKGLDYLQLMFKILIDNKYRLLESEASAFIPYLINKIGDSKDSICNSVRSLLNQITRIYPIFKLFTYVMDGMNSENARQRTQCLEVITDIIEDFGITACMPTPADCLKEVAKHISDEVKSVRDAALNFIVQAYNIVGEKVYQLVGNISEKDRTLLEERIKQSSRKTVSLSILDMNDTSSITSSQKINISQPKTKLNSTDSTDDDGMEDISERIRFPYSLSSQIKVAESQKENQAPLSSDFMEELDRHKPPRPVKFKRVGQDHNLLNEEIRMPTVEPAETQVLASRAALIQTDSTITFYEAASKLSVTSSSINYKNQNPVIKRLIKQMGSQNTAVSLAAMNQLNELLATTRGNALIDYEEDFMNMIITQFIHIQSADLSVDSFAPKIYKNLFTTIEAFYNNESLGKNVSVPVIKKLMHQLINLILEDRLRNLPTSNAYLRKLNIHCVNIIERSNHTNIICALVQLIKDYISNGSSENHVDLVMKCMWRVIKLMPLWGEDIDYDMVLLEAHNFLKTFPSSLCKSEKIDAPLKTVKTILYSSVKIKGATIMLHLDKISNTDESEVESYILRVLEKLKISDIQHIPVKHKTLTKVYHKTLTDIFQKIGCHDSRNKGLNLLHNFMQQHPEADIEPYVATCSQSFQLYIRRKTTNKEIGDPLNKKKD